MATGLPLGSPDSASFDSYLSEADAMIGEALVASGLNDPTMAVGSIGKGDTGGAITGSVYESVKTFLEGDKMKEIEKKMTKVACGDGTELWVAKENLNAFLASQKGSSVPPKKEGALPVPAPDPMPPAPPAAEVEKLQRRNSELEEHTKSLINQRPSTPDVGGVMHSGNLDRLSKGFLVCNRKVREAHFHFTTTACSRGSAATGEGSCC